MPGIHVKFEIPPEEFLADLTGAAYRVALKHGFKVPFIKIELDLQEALREVIERDMWVSGQCGLFKPCHCEEGHFRPWSEEAEKAYQKGPKGLKKNSPLRVPKKVLPKRR